MARLSRYSIEQVTAQADAYSSNIVPCTTVVNYVPPAGYTPYALATTTTSVTSTVWMTVRYVCGLEMLRGWLHKEVAALRKAFWR